MRSGKSATKSPAPPRIRKTALLSELAIKRLGIAAIMEGCDESDIIETLINRHLSAYVAQVRGERFNLDDRLTAAGAVNSPAPATV